MGIDKPDIRFVIPAIFPNILRTITRKQAAPVVTDWKEKCILYYSHKDVSKARTPDAR